MSTTKKESNRLGTEPIRDLLLEFSIPAVIGMLVNALYNIIDRVFIGHGVGDMAIGGVYVGMPISIIIMAFSMLVGVGGNTLVSIRLGQDREKDAEKILGHSLVLLVIISIVLGSVGTLILEPTLVKFGATPENLHYAMDYMGILMKGVIFQVIGMGMNNFIRGEGNPKMAMVTMLIGAITNTVLNPIFIFGFNLGVKGAAYATVVSQAVSAIWIIYYFTKGNSLLKLKFENFKLKAYLVKEILLLGSSPFSMQLASSLVNVIMNNGLNKYGGPMAITSMSVIQSLIQLVTMPVFGINQGAQPLMGYNYGAKQYERVKRTLWYAIYGATAIMTVGFIFAFIFPEVMFKMFLGQSANLDEVMKIGVPGLRIFVSTLPIIAFQIIGANYFQATGSPKQAMFLSLLRQVIVLIPALFILPRVFNLGLTGVWLAVPISDAIATFMTGWLLRESLKDLDKKSEAML